MSDLVLVGSPSEEILVGFVGDMMVTAEALRVPSSCPLGMELVMWAQSARTYVAGAFHPGPR